MKVLRRMLEMEGSSYTRCLQGGGFGAVEFPQKGHKEAEVLGQPFKNMEGCRRTKGRSLLGRTLEDQPS